MKGDIGNNAERTTYADDGVRRQGVQGNTALIFSSQHWTYKGCVKGQERGTGQLCTGLVLQWISGEVTILGVKLNVEVDNVTDSSQGQNQRNAQTSQWGRRELALFGKITEYKHWFFSR